MFIKIHNVSKTYKNGVQALKKVSLEIQEGEILGLLGVNGCGKTTLSSILTTLLPPTEGDVLYQGQSIYKDLNQYRRIIGFCPQKPNLHNELTVRENLYFDALYFGFSEKDAKDKLDELVEKLWLKEYLHANPNTLSGGYKQRVMIARALMHNPKFIVLDEPTVGLDPDIRRELWDIVAELKKNGMTVLLTTHYLDEAEKLSDRVCVLDKGNVITIDSSQNLKKKFKEKNLENAFIQLIKEQKK
ncbi:MAG: ABC transporter ATP-binding protein [Alphaproteobacteria bacterium]|nr:MAG: ABC transporter ATP-binding protein [Alphaproteobacteria bacterium]